MKASLRQFGFDPEIGKIDIDRVEGHVTAAQRSKIRILLDVIEELTSTLGKNIPKEDIVKMAKSRGLKEFDIEKMLNELKSNGTLFEPRPGILQKM
jgi:replicative DNA helicase Mcm